MHQWESKSSETHSILIISLFSTSHQYLSTTIPKLNSNISVSIDYTKRSIEEIEYKINIINKKLEDQILDIDEERLAKGENLEYVKDTPNAIDESISAVDSGKKQAAFFMNPVKMQQLKLVTDEGERMPQKSTYFYPKIFTGLTIQKL